MNTIGTLAHYSLQALLVVLQLAVFCFLWVALSFATTGTPAIFYFFVLVAVLWAASAHYQPRVTA